MITPDTIASFVDRMKRERVEQGLPPAIVDANVLATVAALVARPATKSPSKQ